jgi:hypothetical protein
MRHDPAPARPLPWSGGSLTTSNASSQEVAMTNSRRVQPDKVYTVQLERKPLQVKAIRESVDMPGWWLCETAQSKDRLFLPESSFPETNPD